MKPGLDLKAIQKEIKDREREYNKRNRFLDSFIGEFIDLEEQNEFILDLQEISPLQINGSEQRGYDHSNRGLCGSDSVCRVF